MRTFLAITRNNTVESIRDLFVATASMPDGIGVAESGDRLTAFTTMYSSRGSASIEIRDVSARNAIWPIPGTAPYVWIITPEDDGDLDLYRFVRPLNPTHGMAVTPTVHSQRLVIDGVPYLLASQQLTGNRDPVVILVSGYKVERVLDTRSRSVSIDKVPSRSRSVPEPLSNVFVRYGVKASSRSFRMSVPVWNFSTGRWEHVSMGQLIGDLVDVADTNKRYIAFKVYDSDNPDQPTFTADEITSGSSGVGLDTAIADPTVPSDATRIWVAAAIPTGVPFDWYAHGGAFNPGLNLRLEFDADPKSTMMVDGDSYDIYVSSVSIEATFYGTGNHSYFSADATAGE